MQNPNAVKEKFKVLTISQLNQIIEQKSALIETEYIFEKNATFVTEFKDGSTIMKPPVLGNPEGIFFSSKADMLEMMASGVYPVKGSGSFWEREKQRIVNFKNEMPYYLNMLSKTLGQEIEISQDQSYLDKVSTFINTFLKQKRKPSKDQYCYIAMYVAEVMRIREKGEWQFLPEYSFNMSYIPEIVSNNKACNPWGFIISDLEMADVMPISITKTIENASLFMPVGKRNLLTADKL